MTGKKRRNMGIAWLVLGLVFVGLGLLRKEHLTVLEKAVAICLECIGIG